MKHGVGDNAEYRVEAYDVAERISPGLSIVAKIGKTTRLHHERRMIGLAKNVARSISERETYGQRARFYKRSPFIYD